jgi:hypothetical protein
MFFVGISKVNDENKEDPDLLKGIDPRIRILSKMS